MEWFEKLGEPPPTGFCKTIMLGCNEMSIIDGQQRITTIFLTARDDDDTVRISDSDDDQSAVSDIDSDFTESSYTNTSDVSDESLKKEEEKSSGNDEIVKVAEEKKEDGSLLEVEKKEDKSETISLSESDDFSDSFESSYLSSFSLEDIGVQTNESFVETYKKLTADTNYVSKSERAKSCPPVMKRVRNFSESYKEKK